MNKYTELLAKLRTTFIEENIFMLNIPPLILKHISDLSSEHESIVAQNGDKALIVYVKDMDCVVLGSKVKDNKRTFKQLLVMSFNDLNNKICDNTKKEIDQSELSITLVNWLKQ